MAKILKVEQRTEEFIEALKKLKEAHKLPSNADLAGILGISSPATISEIKGRRQNIQPESWKRFQKHFHKEISGFSRSELVTSENSTQIGANTSNVDILLDIISKQADTIKIQQETIFFLTTKGGDVGGRAVATTG